MDTDKLGRIVSLFIIWLAAILVGSILLGFTILVWRTILGV
jgi:hypothetical protein